jgi:hypothetical protein
MKCLSSFNLPRQHRYSTVQNSQAFINGIIANTPEDWRGYHEDATSMSDYDDPKPKNKKKAEDKDDDHEEEGEQDEQDEQDAQDEDEEEDNDDDEEVRCSTARQD